MTMDAVEFLRRFCLHILPHGFRKIRHCGILASRNKPKLHIQQVQMGVLTRPIVKLHWKQIANEKLNYNVDACLCCKTGKMIRLLSFEANAPPPIALINAQKKLVLNKQ